MKGLFIPEVTSEMFRNGCLESIETLMAEGEIHDIEYSPWIPVSERLPEKEMNCLVTDSLGKVHTVTFYQALDGRESYFSGCYCVRAWMPLPKPYKAESEEQKWTD